MRLGIDIGGTKIEAAALEADGTIRLRRRLPTPAGDYQGIIATVKALIAGIETDLGPVESVGVGIPGMLSPSTGLVKNANSTCLIGRPSTATSQTLWTGRCDWPMMLIASLSARRSTVPPRAPGSFSASFSAPVSAAGLWSTGGS
jgi:hypothetical protein